MRKILTLITMLLLSALWLQAQSGDPGMTRMQAPNATGPTTIDGCLQAPGGHYTLIDNNGKAHTLTGDTARLSHYVGHQVEITGTPTIKTIDTSEQNIASSVEEVPAFRIKSAKLIAKTCKSSTQ